MADEISKIGKSNALGSALEDASPLKKKNDAIGQQEFLQLLVTQLKNQDPLDPSNAEEFAVNLAQFSQLEQLVSINEKLEGGSEGGALTSMAAYLGHEVTLDSDKVTVNNKDGGLLKLELPADAQVTVELKGATGDTIGTVDLGTVPAGSQTVSLAGLDVPNGQYGFSVTASTAAGSVDAKPKVAGIVSGFVPGPEPTLIVNGQEISPSQVLAVNVPK